ncbi:unnamed protein product [Diabrotica balteata]|uniref:Uncharacterized protein n=1 Tax=Diabrotica balteata TaxID=107213 RepID=A0A9P0GTC5_DIABA|nr:unnamed protein product [Diabrotica balteata]
MLGYYLFLLVVYIICIANISAWETPSPHQYHIQTDEGPERYFRYQTDSGQYRKEKRLEDGTVVGTYAWIDADGMLRQRDYIADNEGYRILKTKNVFVGRNMNVGDAIKSAKKYPATAGTLVKTRPDSYRGPIRGYNSVSFVPSSTQSPIPSSSYSPYIPSSTPSSTYVPSSTPSPVSFSSYNPSSLYIPSTTPTTVPSSTYRPSSISTISGSQYLNLDLSLKSLSPSPYSHLSSTEQPVVQITPNAFPKTAYGYVPLNFSYFNGNQIQSTPIPLVQPTEVPYYRSSPTPIAGTTERPVIYSPSYSPADFGSSQEVDSNSLEYNPYVRQVKDTYRFQNGPTYPLDRNGRPYVGSDSKHPTYDGVSVTNDGFRYYIPRAYHEEETQPGDKRSGSFGYIDPFGIRRVIYYNTAPGTGFQHRKNNRYVGFNAAPYDPRPYSE